MKRFAEAPPTMAISAINSDTSSKLPMRTVTICAFARRNNSLLLPTGASIDISNSYMIVIGTEQSPQLLLVPQAQAVAPRAQILYGRD